MFFDRDIKGDRLPPRTLCLTYDDGPGPHTRQLGRFLFEEGIGATFFVIGRHAEADLDTLACLRQWGHLIGNHTYSHPGLVSLALGGGDVVDEVARTDAIIRPYVSGEFTFLRAPYGNWREKKAADSPEDRNVSVVADALNRSGRFENYVGPVNWVISAADYDYWKRAASAEDCARAYLDKIERLSRGIVLMHDSSDEEAVKENNQAMQTTKLLVPLLKAKGYRFVRLDSLPQLRSALAVRRQVTLRAADGRSLVREGDTILLAAADEEDCEVFGLVELGEGRIALRASNGLFLSAPAEGGEVSAKGLEASEQETLAVETLPGGSWRTSDGKYFASGRGDKLFAEARSRRPLGELTVCDRFGRG